MTFTFHEFRDTTWRTVADRQIKVKDIEVSQLINALNTGRGRVGFFGESLFDLLEQEVIYRKIFLFAAGSPIPFKGEDGQWSLIDSTTGETVIVEKSDHTG